MNLTTVVTLVALVVAWLLYQILLALRGFTPPSAKQWDPQFPVFSRARIEEAQRELREEEYHASLLDAKIKTTRELISQITTPDSRTGRISDEELYLRADLEYLHEQAVTRHHNARREETRFQQMVEYNYSVINGTMSISQVKDAVWNALCEDADPLIDTQRIAREYRAKHGDFQRCPGCRVEIELGKSTCSSCFSTHHDKVWERRKNASI